MFNTDRIADWIYYHIKPLFWTAILFGTVSFCGIIFIQFDSNFRSFFPEDSELISTFDDILEQYDQGESLLLYLKLPNDNQITSKNIEAIKTADELVNSLPHVRYVRSLTSFQKSFADDESINNKFVGDWAEETNGIKAVNSYLSIQDQLKGRLVSEDRSGAVVLAQVDLPDPRYQSVSHLMKVAKDVADEIEQQYPGVVVHISGTAAFDHGLLSEFYSFAFLTFPLAVFLVSFLVAWIFSPYILMSGLLACGLTMFATAGIIGWLPVTLDQTAVMGILLVFILTVVDCMHFGGTYMVAIAKSYPKERAIKEAISTNLIPIFFTTLTTSVGLTTLLITGSPPFVLFAQIALVGIVIGYVFSIIIPTMFLIWLKPQVQSRSSPIPYLVAQTKKTVTGWPKLILVCFVGLTVLSIALIPLNTVDEDIRDYFMPSTEIDKAFETIQDDFRADNQLTIDIFSKGDTFIISPEMYLAIDEFEAWINSKPSVVSTFSANDIIKEIKALWDNETKSNQLPQSREEYSQLLAVYEMSLLQGQSSAEFISPDRSQTLMTVFLEDLSNHEVLRLQKNIKQWWGQQDVEVRISGRDVIFAELSESTVRSSMIGAGIAAVVISLFMIIAFRSIKWGLFSLIPNVLPFLMLFGAWAILYGEINQATCMAFTIVLGIVMDDSIHFITKFRYAVTEMSTEEAIEKTFDYVGWAITATSLSFIATGAVILTTSTFIPNAIVGAFLIVCLFFAWVCDMFLLPALLKIFYQQGESQMSAEAGTLNEAA